MENKVENKVETVYIYVFSTLLKKRENVPNQSQDEKRPFEARFPT